MLKIKPSLLIALGSALIVIVLALLLFWPKEAEIVPLTTSLNKVNSKIYQVVKDKKRFAITFQDENKNLISKVSVIENEVIELPEIFKNKKYVITNENNETITLADLKAQADLTFTLVKPEAPKTKPQVQSAKTVVKKQPTTETVQSDNNSPIRLSFRIPALRMADEKEFLIVTLTGESTYMVTDIPEVVGYNFLGWDRDMSKPFSQSEIIYAKLEARNDQSAVQIGNTTIYGYFNNTMAQETLSYMNEYRRLHNLAPLSYAYDLQEKANLRAAEAVILYDHTRPDGSFFNSIDSRLTSENLAYGQKDARAVVTAWYNSPDHRAIILNPDTTHFATGYFNSSDRNRPYWVQIFY